MQKQRIAIVGAGFAGLSSAILLCRAGHEVQLFDRFTQPASKGAGILIQPTGMQAMRRLGVLDEMLACGARIDSLYGVSGASPACQRHVLDIQYAHWKKPTLDPAYGLGLHRGSLFSCLWNVAQELRIPVHIGTEIEDIGALRYEFDAVVLAGGAHCQLRQQLDVASSYSPYPWGAVWAVLPDVDNVYQGRLWQWYESAQKMLGIMPTGYLRTVAGERGGSPLVSVFWSLPVSDFAAWKARGLEAALQEMLMLNPDAEPLLSQVDSIDDWTFAHYADVRMPRRMYDGNCIVIGDAAHACSPQLGQGTNMALVDAVALADAFAAHDSVADAFAAFQSQRAKQLRFYSHASRMFTPMYQSYGRVLPWCRDYIMPSIMKYLPMANRAQVEILVGVRKGWLW